MLPVFWIAPEDDITVTVNEPRLPGVIRPRQPAIAAAQISSTARNTSPSRRRVLLPRTHPANKRGTRKMTARIVSLKVVLPPIEAERTGLVKIVSSTLAGNAAAATFTGLKAQCAPDGSPEHENLTGLDNEPSLPTCKANSADCPRLMVACAGETCRLSLSGAGAGA